jgi:O-antigen/teichoic acid export membrane protein
MDAQSEAPQDDRDETTLERLDRQWGELLQELRVSQTGVQLLTAFLLSLPFQARFQSITHAQRALYLTTVAFSLVSAGLLLAPVSMHRRVFRRHERGELVRVANVLAQAGLATLSLALAGVATLIFDVTEGQTTGIVVGACTLVGLGSLWFVAPAFFPRLWGIRRTH